MPCRDYQEGISTESAMLTIRDAMLCAILSTLEESNKLDKVLLEINKRVSESGVSSKQIQSWWEAHKKADRARREAEQALRARQLREDRVRKSALDKLTDEEKQLLRLR